MSLRLVSSARSLRDQFKSSSGGCSNNNLLASSGNSVFTNSSGISQSRTADPFSSGTSILSRQETLMRSSSNGNVNRTRSVQKKNSHDALPELSMEMTLVIVNRCVKEIRERGMFPLLHTTQYSQSDSKRNGTA